MPAGKMDSETNNMENAQQQDLQRHERVVEIRNADGLHMRPAMQFVECANGYDCKVSVYKDSLCVDGKSIMQMTMLAATCGTKLRISAEGHDAAEAADRLAEILERAAEDSG